MADPEATTIPIPLRLPADEALALAQLVKRIDYGTCNRFADACVTYSGRTEGDVIWSTICLLQRQLADAGFSPR